MRETDLRERRGHRKDRTRASPRISAVGNCSFSSRVTFLTIYWPNSLGFPRWPSGKESACQCKRLKRHRFNPWVRRSPGGGNSNPLQYSWLENSIDKGAWWATVHGVPKSWTWLSTHTHTHSKINHRNSRIKKKIRILFALYMLNKWSSKMYFEFSILTVVASLTMKKSLKFSECISLICDNLSQPF